MMVGLTYKKETFLALTISLSFVIINAFLITKEFYYLNLVPWLLLLLMLAFYSLDRILLLIIFFTPLSIELSYLFPWLEFDVYMPTEPMMLAVLLLVILKYLQGEGFDRNILRHPVSIAIYFSLTWILITTITSSMPPVSIKFLFARIWFVVTFYFLAVQFFKSFHNIHKYIWVFILPMLVVIFIVLFKLSSFGFFNQEAAHKVVRPFFNDHTSYGAILAFLIPVLATSFFNNPAIKGILKLLILVILIIFLTALVLSYSRAAWSSLFGAMVIYILIKMRIRFLFLIVFGVILALFIYSYRTEIIIKLEQNRQDSSKNLAQHVKSISNVATDASNLERINRWSCAWRMFKEKPVFGWGPGTYMFQYAPFQISREKTIISTTFATGGNAHSEYIGPLSESGLPGMITFLWIVIAAILTGLRVYRKSASKYTRALVVSVLVGLFTYFIHGLMNNFLDTDKASALFWGFIAILVAMDIYHKTPLISKEIPEGRNT